MKLTEKIVDVFGYKGLYKISNYGYIISIERKDNKKRPVSSKIIYGNPYKTGHKRVTLFKDGIRGKYLVHRFVAIHFLKNKNNYKVVMHLDDDATNNRVDNLAWGTHKDNSEDMVRKNRQAKGERNGMYGKRGLDCPASKLVIDTETGIFYYSIVEAAFAKGLNTKTLSCYLTGNRKNKTNLKFA